MGFRDEREGERGMRAGVESGLGIWVLVEEGGKDTLWLPYSFGSTRKDLKYYFV